MSFTDDEESVGAFGAGYAYPSFLPQWWGRGLGREAVAATVEWARKLPGEFPVVAVAQSANTGSRRLLEAIGLSVAQRGGRVRRAADGCD
ncbi:GNAT family N-acetyltransferase [Streptomyces sp. Rer75]|uniref:GNAT family N-acetyltransferase n=1 Tax=unclassified Streptomyces TaxID=2593676 RepID=UPI00211E459F|nr:GNAT family N-acetyltransferase [Streptomyces sp. Rer75]